MKHLFSSIAYNHIRAHFSLRSSVYTSDDLLSRGTVLKSSDSIDFVPKSYRIFDSLSNKSPLQYLLPQELLHCQGTVASGFAILDNAMLVGNQAYAIHDKRLVLESCQGRLGYPLFRGDIRSLLLRHIFTTEKVFDIACSIVHSLSGNYFHFLIETLPLLGAVHSAISLQDLSQSSKPIACFVPSVRPSFIDFWVHAALGDRAFLVPWTFNKVKVSSFITATLPYRVLSSTNDPIPRWGIQRYLSSGLEYVRKLGYKYTANYIYTHLPKKVFLGRRSLSRIIINASELDEFLTSNSYSTIFLEDLSIPDQIALFRNVSHLIALHGAGLANLVFAHQIHIIELFPSSRRTEMLHFFCQLSSWIEATHSVLICDADCNENMIVNLRTLETLL